MEKKVFGYPKYNDQGEMILTTYDNEYRDMKMDIRMYDINAGQSRSFERKGEEIAVLLLSGKIVFSWDGEKREVSIILPIIPPIHLQTLLFLKLKIY